MQCEISINAEFEMNGQYNNTYQSLLWELSSDGKRLVTYYNYNFKYFDIFNIYFLLFLYHIQCYLFYLICDNLNIFLIVEMEEHLANSEISLLLNYLMDLQYILYFIFYILR